MSVLALVLTAACSLSEQEYPTTAPRPTPTQDAAVPPDSAVHLVAGLGGGLVNQLGTAPVRIGIATLAGGKLTTAPGPDGSTALRFPAYRATGRYPRAIVSVRALGSTDALSPGDSSFSWGADFKIDTESAGRGIDNGNNLLARGLYNDPGLFKAELDDKQPSCTVRGSEGIVVAVAHESVTPGIWYRMRCQRTGQYVTVRAWQIDQTTPSITAVQVGPIGVVDFPDRQIPLCVGGKLSSDGQVIASATDQFNGEVANPFVRIGTTG